MKRQNSRHVGLAIAFLFFFIVSVFHFTHTELGPCRDDECAACRLQFMVLGVALVIFTLLPLLILELFFEPIQQPEYESRFAPRVSSRAPPLI